MRDDFSRRTLLSLDTEGYSSRNDIEQHALQRALLTVLETAAEQAGFDRSRWAVQSAGDGELAVLPPDVAESKVIDELPAALAHALAVRNGAVRDGVRLRLRLAVHQGLVRRAAGGYAGHGVVAVSRMVDSALARRALIACPSADLVVLLSSSLYTELVVQGHTALSCEDFRKVAITNKGFEQFAWLHVPGHDVHGLDLDEPAASRSRPDTRSAAPGEAAGAGPAVVTEVRGGVHSENVVFGIQNGGR